MNKDEFWKECLSHIKSSISDQAYSTWFDGLSLTDLNNEELTIQVPNKFTIKFLNRRKCYMVYV